MPNSGIFDMWNDWYTQYHPLKTLQKAKSGVETVHFTQAIIWTYAVLSSIEPLRTNVSQIILKIQTFSFKKMHLKMTAAKRRPFRLGLNVLTHWQF